MTRVANMYAGFRQRNHPHRPTHPSIGQTYQPRIALNVLRKTQPSPPLHYRQDLRVLDPHPDTSLSARTEF